MIASVYKSTASWYFCAFNASLPLALKLSAFSNSLRVVGFAMFFRLILESSRMISALVSHNLEMMSEATTLGVNPLYPEVSCSKRSASSLAIIICQRKFHIPIPSPLGAPHASPMLDSLVKSAKISVRLSKLSKSLIFRVRSLV